MEDKKLVQLLLDTEEWQTFDCKRALIKPAHLLETVVGFANADGGWILLGMEDPAKANGPARLFGVNEQPDHVSEFLKLIDKEIDPPLRFWSRLEIPIVNNRNETDKLLAIKIGKGADVHSLRKGDTFIRKGKQNPKIGASEIMRLKQEKGSISFESERCEGVAIGDLDSVLLLQYKKDTRSTGADDQQFLKDNGLAMTEEDRYVPTKAAALLFGKNPSVLLKSKAGIKVSHYYGTKPTFTHVPNFVARPFTVEGPLMRQIQEVMEYFREIVKRSPPKLVGAGFAPTFLVPEWAFQEAITNAVIHRNYAVQDDIQVRFFDDRVEIESPGTYPGHITVANIRNERFARNPIVLRTLNRFQGAPNLDIGEGVDRMFQVMKEHNLYEPFYLPANTRPHSVLLILFNLQKIQYWDTVSKYLDERQRITNKEAREITGIPDIIEMSRLLKLWVSKGLLEKVDSKFKGNVYYQKSGMTVAKELDNAFAKGGANGTGGLSFSAQIS